MKRIILVVSFMGLICSCVLSQQINIPEHDSIFRNFRKEIHKGIPGMPLGISPYADPGINLYNKDLFSGEGIPKSSEYLMADKLFSFNSMPCLKPVGNFPSRIIRPDTSLRYNLIIIKP